MDRSLRNTNSYDLVYKWFDHLKREGYYINAFVIMPNHLHAIIGFRETNKSINTIVGNGKRFLAYGIVNRLKKMGRNDILKKLSFGVVGSDHLRGKFHNVWEDSFCWKECVTPMFLTQKLNYIHFNPCQTKRRLVNNPSTYIHSSAGYYLEGHSCIYPVTHYSEMNCIDLSAGFDGR
ncbi:hypothetical protein [Pollutibacter soli]|uniref:hypothetical protein n=1 Tax=Pollutibacter soli TaxID=3034157 RepID=UPI003013725D